MKYFGIINNENIKDLSIREIEEYLVEEDIYNCNFSNEQMSKMLNNSFEFDFSEIETTNIPKIELINEFHEFIYKTYQKHVINIKYNYFSSFNEDFYGLEFLELRKNSLIDFKDIFNSLNIGLMDIIDERLSNNGITHTHTTGKLYKLYFFQQNQKKSMASTDNIMNYLIGDAAFYDEEFYERNIEIIKGVHLEIYKQILVEINDKYSFEEDIYFSKKVSDVFKFKDYNYIFKNLESYQFTNKIISNNINLKRVDIESLYQVLLDFDLIKDHKENFIAFVKADYKFIVTKITTFAPKQNIQNDKRIKFLIQEWENQDVQKTDLDMFQNF